MSLLAARGFRVPYELRVRIEKCQDSSVLNYWIRRAATITEIEQLDAPLLSPEEYDRAEMIGMAKALLEVLSARRVEVPPYVANQIKACRDALKIKRWIHQATTIIRIHELEE